MKLLKFAQSFSTLILHPTVTLVALSSSAAGVLNASPFEMVVPTVNKAIPLENLPETSVPGQEINSPEEPSIQTSADQSNGVAAKQSVQGATADPVGTAEESVLSAEALTEAVHSQASVFAATEEVANQEVKQISVEAEASGEELREGAAKILNDPKPSPPEDVGENDEYENMAVESSKNLCLDTAQEEHVSGDVNNDVATQNESLNKKGTTKCEGPPISTRHLSGWFK